MAIVLPEAKLHNMLTVLHLVASPADNPALQHRLMCDTACATFQGVAKCLDSGVVQALVSALASGNAEAAGQAYAAALNAGGSVAAAATTAVATAIATANCNGVIVTALASKIPL